MYVLKFDYNFLIPMSDYNISYRETRSISLPHCVYVCMCNSCSDRAIYY